MNKRHANPMVGLPANIKKNLKKDPVIVPKIQLVVVLTVLE